MSGLALGKGGACWGLPVAPGLLSGGRPSVKAVVGHAPGAYAQALSTAPSTRSQACALSPFLSPLSSLGNCEGQGQCLEPESPQARGVGVGLTARLTLQLHFRGSLLGGHTAPLTLCLPWEIAFFLMLFLLNFSLSSLLSIFTDLHSFSL